MKKKSFLLLVYALVAVSAMAVEWPATYTYANKGSWFGHEPAYAEEYTRNTAIAQNFKKFTLPEDFEDFDAAYASIGDEYGIDKLRSDHVTANATPAKFKVAYTDEAIYVLLTYDAPTGAGMTAELMFCPYDKLQNAPEVPGDLSQYDKGGVPWLRIGELGGFLVETILINNKFGVNSFIACSNGPNGYSQVLPNFEGITLNDCSTSEAVKLAFKIEYSAMNDKLNNVDFTLETWKTACEGKGVSFEVRFKKGAYCQYMWNTDNNNVYYSNSYAGYLTPKVECEEIMAQGSAGNLNWTLDCDGVLTIGGTGAMPDYSDNSAPWYNYSFHVTQVEIGDGVTAIGSYAFRGYSGLASITIPSSVTSIGEEAFTNCYALASITCNAIVAPGASGQNQNYNPFGGVPKSIPVTIPDGCSYMSYAKSPLWAHFDCFRVKDLSSAICMVSVDENNHNRIVCEKSAEAAGYNIYREGNVSGQYELVQTVSGNNVWVDEGSNARMRSYKYKIAGITDCGDETDISSAHKTMHLTINAGLNGSWNLIWTLYEGVSFETYNIYRATSAGGEMELIGTMPGGNTSFSDFSAPAGYVYYVVEIVLDHACEEYSTPEARSSFIMGKAGASFASIRSNLATNNPISIDGAATENIGIYPNPVQEYFYIDGIGENTSVTVSDASGRVVLQTVAILNEPVSVAHLPRGMYIVNAAGKTIKVVKL